MDTILGSVNKWKGEWCMVRGIAHPALESTAETVCFLLHFRRKYRGSIANPDPDPIQTQLMSSGLRKHKFSCCIHYYCDVGPSRHEQNNQ